MAFFTSPACGERPARSPSSSYVLLVKAEWCPGHTFLLAASGRRVGRMDRCIGLGASLAATVDRSLMRGLVTDTSMVRRGAASH